MSGKKLKIGIIGCGRIAREGHLPYLMKHPNVDLCGAVDVSGEHCESVCEKFGIGESFVVAEEMLDRTRPDGIFICTPNWAHRELTLAAAARGVHVFCEKPMAVNATEALEMVEACEKAGVFLQIGMVKRFDAGIAKAKRMVAAGQLGEVSQIYTHALNPPARLDTPVMELFEKWGKAVGYDLNEKMGLWRVRDERTGGGHLLEMGTHMLDLAIYFAGEEPAEWSGYINKKRPDMVWEDQGTLLVKYPSGKISTTEVNMSVTSDNLIGENGRIFGDKATLEFSHLHGMWFGIPFYEYIPTRLTLFGRFSPFLGIGLPLPVNIGKRHYMHKLQVDYFVDRILGKDTDYFGFGNEIAATGRDGLAVMRVIDKAYGKQ